jgi:RND family efflux transporter MFP subunit
VKKYKDIFMKPKLTRAITFSALAGIAVAGFPSCSSSDANSSKEKTEMAPASAPEVDAFVLQKGQLSSSIQMPGELIAYQQVDLFAKVSSFVKKVYVDVGSEVSAGQLLVAMEAPELNSQLTGAQSRLNSQEAIYLSSKATYDRLLETSKTPGTVSQNDLDVAFARQKSDKAQLEAAKASFNEVGDTRNYLNIRAPFGGVISARNVSAGAYVGPAGKGSDLPIFTLQEQKKLRLVVSVPESYTSYMNRKTEVNFVVKSLPNKTFKAKVARLAGALDLRLRSQRVEMDVANMDKKLLPGMVADVFIPLTNSDVNVFVVPSSAVINAALGIYVVRVSDHKASWVPVKIGRSAGGKTEIFGAVSAQDVIVKSATEETRDGSEIKNLKIMEIR